MLGPSSGFWSLDNGELLLIESTRGAGCRSEGFCKILIMQKPGIARDSGWESLRQQVWRFLAEFQSGAVGVYRLEPFKSSGRGSVGHLLGLVGGWVDSVLGFL